MKELKIITKKLNKKKYEILRNLELLCFIDIKNLKEFLKIYII